MNDVRWHREFLGKFNSFILKMLLLCRIVLQQAFDFLLELMLEILENKINFINNHSAFVVFMTQTIDEGYNFMNLCSWTHLQPHIFT